MAERMPCLIPTRSDLVLHAPTGETVAAEIENLKIADGEKANKADLDAQNTYSTTETWTGRYWIDGKKIYRKVIIGSTAITTGSDFYKDDTIETLISATGTAKNMAGTLVATVPFSDPATHIGIYRNKEKDFMFSAISAWYLAFAVLEYTCTDR